MEHRPSSGAGRRSMRGWLLFGSLALVATAPAAAQSPPPIQGTIALKGTMTKFYRALNALVVTTVDGAQHVYHFTAGLLVHGSKGSGPDALAGLRPGTSVVVHYRIDGAEESVEEVDSLADEGLKSADGVVTRLDRRRREMVLKLGDGTTSTLRLTDRAASEAAGDITGDGHTRVIVYYTDESGYRLVHYFRKMP